MESTQNFLVYRQGAIDSKALKPEDFFEVFGGLTSFQFYKTILGFLPRILKRPPEVGVEFLRPNLLSWILG